MYTPKTKKKKAQQNRGKRKQQNRSHNHDHDHNLLLLVQSLTNSVLNVGHACYTNEAEWRGTDMICCILKHLHIHLLNITFVSKYSHGRCETKYIRKNSEIAK